MLYRLQDTSDKYIDHLKQDPIRPNIPLESRLGANRDIFILLDDRQVNAITCVSYQKDIPNSETELFQESDPQVVVFYTIWSYKPGSGRRLIMDCVKYIKDTHPNINRFVTLSPKTEIAKKFHLSNGAVIFKENMDTVNYEYLLSSAQSI